MVCRQLLASFVLLACLMQMAMASTSNDAQHLARMQLSAINRLRIDGYLHDQRKFLDELTHPDFRLLDTDGQWYDRAGFMRRMAAHGELRHVSSKNVRLRLLGDVAIVHGDRHSVLIDGTTSDARYTDVYLRQGSQWYLLSSQFTPMRQADGLDEGSLQSYAAWPGTDPAGPDPEVLQVLNEQYVQAFRDADVAWYNHHLAPDYLVIFGDGSIHDRAAALADFSKPYYADSIKSFPLDHVVIRQFGDVAIIHAENDYELKDGRKGINRYTDIWHKRENRWWCVAAHITVFKPPQVKGEE